MGLCLITNAGIEKETTMNFWETITGSDMTKEYKAFNARAHKLPADYQGAWEQINEYMLPYSDFTGRNLMPILDGVLGFMEESAGEGQSAEAALGNDIAGFCAALAGEEGAKTFRDKWRDQLNATVHKKLGK